MKDYSQLIEKGYYVGNLTEIFPDLQRLRDIIPAIKLHAEKIDKTTCQYWNCLHGEHGYHFVSKINDPRRIPARKKFIEKNNFDVDQQWWQLSGEEHLRKFFRNYILDFASKIYTDLNESNIYHQDMLTVYRPGDFSKSHRDGRNPGRRCVFLLYLNEEHEYQDSDGGKLIIQDDGIYEEVRPVITNFAMLDFSRHNVFHSVELVKNNFNRYAYVNFVVNKEESGHA